mgnify:CR=1 FL=1
MLRRARNGAVGRPTRSLRRLLARTKSHGGYPGAHREPKSKGKSPCTRGIGFLVSPMCSGGGKWVYQVPEALESNNNVPKRAKTSQNRPKSFVSRARTPKKQNLARKVTFLGRKSTWGAHIKRSERFASSGAVCGARCVPYTR